jgi:hypothetical protein
LAKKKYFAFLTLDEKPSYSSSPILEKSLTSTGDGEKFISEDEVILGMFFFNNNKKCIHERSVYNMLQLLSQTGGIATSLMAVLGFLVSIVNYYTFVMHFMYLLYFVWDEDPDSTDMNEFTSQIKKVTSNKIFTSMKEAGEKIDNQRKNKGGFRGDVKVTKSHDPIAKEGGDPDIENDQWIPQNSKSNTNLKKTSSTVHNLPPISPFKTKTQSRLSPK